ncbi:hypothetical protein NVV94_19335 [Pseudomonas sp. LS1212]|uniref:hypothetical protein n=1 Tax=Pseudomonas sp. LS1212 TaxID=2972478 RepID=UPI00215D049E|nr:hypothetical protein [Pseudomonas sp. LS1212]UVJ42737.1 hypothetical protein NVV94_19335 [Pseudomonas sp. LS1212]
MPYRPRRREMYITLNPLHLTGCIALGLWLGFVAIVLTCWLAYKFLFNAPLPLSDAAGSLGSPAISQPAPENPMFEQYKDNLRKQELQQAQDQARSNERNLSNPKCQFWLQQNQTAPTDKSRANVLKFCD